VKAGHWPVVWIAIGAVCGFVGVAAGAFGAHMLRERLAADLLDPFEVGVRYHLLHAVMLVLVGTLRGSSRTRMLTVAGWTFLLGIILFSGSLYALALTGVRAFGMITPLGGAAFLVGWLALFVAALRTPSNPRRT